MTTPPRKGRTALIVSLVLLVLVAAGWYGWHARTAAAAKKAEAAKPPATVPVPVTMARVEQQDVPIYHTGIGTVTPLQTVTVRTRIDGQLDHIGYTEGQDVKAGQMIARIDPRTAQAQLAQAQAQAARDQATLANARVDLQRYSKLITEDASTPQQVDTQKALVAQLEAVAKTDQALIRNAQVQLSFTTITAPISGRVGNRLVDPGNIVHASDAGGLVVINQIDPISVVFTLPEGNFQDINTALHASDKSRKPLVVKVFARDGDALIGTGELVVLNNQIDTTSGTVQLKGAFPNAAHKLWPGQYVNARLVLGERQNALTIPAAAVQRGPDGTFVYLVEPDGTSVKMQPIKIAVTQEGRAVVDEGLQVGQQVVVTGQARLKPGTKVEQIAADKADGAASAASAASGASGAGGVAKAGKASKTKEAKVSKGDAPSSEDSK